MPQTIRTLEPYMQNLDGYSSTTTNITTLPTMDPPTYTPSAPAAPPPPHRSILDLRAQILAHGTIIKPQNDSQYGPEDHIELLVAKTPKLTSSQQAYRTQNFNEKQSSKMRPDGTFDFQLARQQTAGSLSAASSSSAGADRKHYAVLVRRNGSNERIRIIIKGEPKDTIEEALEWMLERTQMIVHDMVVKNSKQDVDECVIM
ncbi:hypothetical protein LTR09_007183 [Extremus antarcticus]|uniref:Uncharacterized protein n=1 Tax=Extremus antarcticus TaxID=702011 RepID=A0AAJ0DD04_9PEZI|nr:hypothetical protein LTR09_007183 [Extremus antarcticus]